MSTSSQQNCNIGTVNTGQACVPVMKEVVKWLMWPKYDSTGALNEIDLTAGPFDETYWKALVNHADPSKRLYPLPEIKNLEDLRADAIFEAANDGEKFFVQEGIRSVKGWLFASSAPPQMLPKVNSMRGAGMALLGVDKEFNLIGKRGSSATKFAPVEIGNDTIYASFFKSQNQTIQKIAIMFDINPREDDAEIWMIQASNLAYNLTELEGLIDVTSTVTNKTVNGFTIKLNTDGGDAITPVLVKNLLAADFVSSVGGATAKVRNQTDAADVSITIAESPKGVYAITFGAAQTSGDVIIVKPLRDGYDFSAVEAATVTIP